MKTEQKRFVRFYSTYAAESEKHTESLKAQAPLMLGQGGNSNGSTKGIAKRKTRNGDNGLTKQGAASLSKSGQRKK